MVCWEMISNLANFEMTGVDFGGGEEEGTEAEPCDEAIHTFNHHY